MTDQRTPFQCSASGRGGPVADADDPTAQRSPGPAASIPATMAIEGVVGARNAVHRPADQRSNTTGAVRYAAPAIQTTFVPGTAEAAWNASGGEWCAVRTTSQSPEAAVAEPQGTTTITTASSSARKRGWPRLLVM
jgi:hypothetical protein